MLSCLDAQSITDDRISLVQMCFRIRFQNQFVGFNRPRTFRNNRLGFFRQVGINERMIFMQL